MLVVIRGAGDIATGIALRLYRAGIRLVLTDLPQPTSIRPHGMLFGSDSIGRNSR